MKKLPLIIQILILAFVYVITSKIGNMLAIPPGNVTPLWPPSGVALAFMLLLGYRVWPAIWLGSFLENWSSLFSPDNILLPFITSFLIALGATLEALAGAYFLKRISGKNDPMYSTYSAFIFIVFSALIACLINATIGSSSLLIFGFLPPENYWITWLTWWLGDSVGVLTLTPTIMLMNSSSLQDFAPKKLLEVLILLLPLSVISFWLIATHNQLAFMLIPFVIWAIFRLGSFWPFLISLYISSIAFSYILQGHNLFGGTSTNQSSLLFQAFIAVVFIIDLFLSSLLNERKRAFDALQKANDELEIKVAQRTKDLSQALEELRHREAQLLQSEKMSSLGVLTAGIAHEINNPINFVLSGLQPLERDFQDILQLLNKSLELKPESNIKEYLKEIHSLSDELELENILKEIPSLISGIRRGAERTSAIVKDFRTFSRLDEGEKKKANLEEGLDATLALLKGQHKTRAEIVKNYGKIGLVNCFPGELNQAFLNILSNALDFLQTTEHPEITIATLQVNSQQVSIMIMDNGMGMTSDVKQKIFDPFFTTKDVGKGVGLGLTIAYKIIKEHKGTIVVESEVGKGSKFTITLPID